MKKTFVVILIVALLATTAMPAFAMDGLKGKGPKGSKPKTFNVAGTVTAVDTALGTVTVKVVQSNAVTKSFVGKEITLTTTVSDTLFFRMGEDDTITPTTIASLVLSDTVRAKGLTIVGSNVFSATVITAGVPLPHSGRGNGSPDGNGNGNGGNGNGNGHGKGKGKK